LQGLAVSIQTFWLFSLPCWLQTWWNLKFFGLHVFAVHFYILHLRKSQVSFNYLFMFLSFCVQRSKVIENCLLAFKTIYSENCRFSYVVGILWSLRSCCGCLMKLYCLRFWGVNISILIFGIFDHMNLISLNLCLW
jgi:hypothetical protein